MLKTQGLVARLISILQTPEDQWPVTSDALRNRLAGIIGTRKIPVIGITGSGGCGKSSLTDELVQRLLRDDGRLRPAIISIDPSKRKTGGALLGDRIRMNSLAGNRVFMRSLATRAALGEIPENFSDILMAVRAAGFDIIFVETAGIGQGDSAIVDVADLTLYVMTKEYGAASQLEKIDMLDFADMVVINKFDKQGSDDALAQVRAEMEEINRRQGGPQGELVVYGAIASKFNDEGVTALYRTLLTLIRQKTSVVLPLPPGTARPTTPQCISSGFSGQPRSVPVRSCGGGESLPCPYSSTVPDCCAGIGIWNKPWQ